MYTRRHRQGNRGALGAPATPQQVTTSKGRMDRGTVSQRIKNATQGGNMVYPGGATKDNHTIMPHDVTLMKKQKKINRRLAMHPNLQLLSSFNGENYADYPSREHVSRAYFFTGIALGKDGYDDAMRNNTGLATMIAGVYTINVSGQYTFEPGMEVMWNAPELPAIGRTGVSLREWNTGEPTGKRPPLIVPYRPEDNHSVLAGTFATINRQAGRRQNPGIKGAGLDQYYNVSAGPNRKMRFNTASQDEAMGVKYGLVSQCLLFTYGLAKLRGDSVSSAAKAIQQIANVLGVFEKNPSDAQTNALNQVLAYMYGPHAGNSARAVEQEFREAFGSVNPRARNSFENQMLRMAKDSMSMLWDAAAIGAQERRGRVFGVAGNHAEPGQGVKVVIGAVAL